MISKYPYKLFYNNTKNMRRLSLQEVLEIEHQNEFLCSFNSQEIAVTTDVKMMRESRELFAIDAFAVGYVLQGYSITEFNNDRYRLEPGKLFIIAPTHSTRIVEYSPDYKVRLLLLDSNGHNLSIHLNYLVKSERWTQTYFHPVISLNEQEARTMKSCLERIKEQIERTDEPNRVPFIRLATVWHHVELDNIMQIHMKEVSDAGKPLTRQQTLARELYIHIVNNYRKEHQAKFYAQKMCLTPQYLNQITTNIFGKTLSSIISDLLFSTARSMLLSSEMSIQEIADELNFADQSSFSKFIKKIAGKSPNALRKSNPHQEII